MKPRSIKEKNTTYDIAKEIPGCVNQPKSVDEFTNVAGTSTNLNFISGSHAIPGVVADAYEDKE